MKCPFTSKMQKALNGRSENFKSFFEWSIDYLCEHKKKVKLSNSRFLNMTPSQRCSGWCDGNEIVVAFKSPLFEQVYVHEFSHMTQCVENSILWKDDFDFWNDLSKGFTIKSYDKILEVIALERDCEKRALALSKKWDLFDNALYAKQANLYLHYYQYIFLTNKWINSTSIYHPLILEKMSDKLQPMSCFSKIDMELMKLFHECVDKKGAFYKKGFSS
jgi:hypothetical protein